jgi:hypothetical protein
MLKTEIGVKLDGGTIEPVAGTAKVFISLPLMKTSD